MPNTIKTRSGRTLALNTPEEEAAINRGIAEDPDTYEVPSEDFKKMRRLGERGKPRPEKSSRDASGEEKSSGDASGEEKDAPRNSRAIEP